MSIIKHVIIRTGGSNILVIRPVYSYNIVLIVLIMFVLLTLIYPLCKVRILAKTWPHLPGWFAEPCSCMYLYIDGLNCLVLFKEAVGY